MKRKAILVLLTYLVKGSLPLRVFRQLRARGFNVVLSYTNAVTGIYTPDKCEDFRAERKLIDLRDRLALDYRRILLQAIVAHNVGAIVQVGCEPLYSILPAIRERQPELKMLDLLFNDIGHVVSHFLFERCFDGVIVETRHMADYVRSCSEIDNRQVHIVESGVDMGLFQPNARPFKDGAQLVVGYIGRLSPEKNPLGFVRLAEALARRSDRLVFKIFGEGNMAGEVRQRVESSPARQHIQFVGYVDDVRSAFSQVDVLIVPSTVDGRPGVIMEANACGIPLIANPVGGIPELIQEGVNGHLRKVDDVDGVAVLLNNWLTKPESFARARESARQTALEQFSNDRMLTRYAEVLSKYVDPSQATVTQAASAKEQRRTATSAYS